jgi:hypothetical protein
MRLVQKDYFTVDELIERWEMSRRDFEYLAENSHLRLSIRVFMASIEWGEYERLGTRCWFPVVTRKGLHSGLLELIETDVIKLLKLGQVSVEYFHAENPNYCKVAEGDDPIDVHLADLLFRDEERIRAEKWMLSTSANPQKSRALTQTNDYQRVSYNGLELHFGPVQAAIVAILHQAFLDDSPWCSGKAILERAGSVSPRMADVFKSQPHWRKLIISDRRGLYRLAAPSTAG